MMKLYYFLRANKIITIFQTYKEIRVAIGAHVECRWANGIGCWIIAIRFSCAIKRHRSVGSCCRCSNCCCCCCRWIGFRWSCCRCWGWCCCSEACRCCLGCCWMLSRKNCWCCRTFCCCFGIGCCCLDFICCGVDCWFGRLSGWTIVWTGHSDDERPFAIPFVIVHRSTIVTLNQRNKFFKIIFHLILILYHIISYVVISMTVAVVAATDDVVVRKVSNSGYLLAISPRNDIFINKLQNWTISVGIVVYSPSGEMNGLIDVIRIVFKRQTSRLNIIYIQNIFIKQNSIEMSLMTLWYKYMWNQPISRV